MSPHKRGCPIQSRSLRLRGVAMPPAIAPPASRRSISASGENPTRFTRFKNTPAQAELGRGTRQHLDPTQSQSARLNAAPRVVWATQPLSSGAGNHRVPSLRTLTISAACPVPQVRVRPLDANLGQEHARASTTDLRFAIGSCPLGFDLHPFDFAQGRIAPTSRRA